MLNTISPQAADLIASVQTCDLRACDLQAFDLQAHDLCEQPGDWDLLLRETHHRMKNTLALLTAWLRLDLVRAKPADLADAVERFERRIVAFGELYGLLSGGAECDEIAVGDYIENLCRALAVAILEPMGIRCKVATDEGFLPATRCERLGLIIAELVTNAAKHAFAGRGRGTVRVDARYRDGSWRCTISDNGIGVVGSSRGAGGRIVQDLARSVRGHTTVESSRRGTAITVVLPH
jgi:two-component sensor histidine kinase